jgi:hypothetical protein
MQDLILLLVGTCDESSRIGFVNLRPGFKFLLGARTFLNPLMNSLPSVRLNY